MDLKAFAAQLPDRSRLFLEMLERKGEVKVSEVVEALGLSSAKAVGGITGAIGRWGPARGVALPYEVVSLGGERGWRWLPGHTLLGAEGKTVAASEPPKPAAKPAAKPAPADPVAAVMDAVPENSRRFLEMLRARKRMTMPEVLRELGLARAQAVTPLLTPIREAAARHNVPTPYNHSSTGTGERVFLWPGTPDVAEPSAPTVKSQPRGIVRRRRRT